MLAPDKRCASSREIGTTWSESRFGHVGERRRHRTPGTQGSSGPTVTGCYSHPKNRPQRLHTGTEPAGTDAAVSRCASASPVVVHALCDLRRLCPSSVETLIGRDTGGSGIKQASSGGTCGDDRAATATPPPPSESRPPPLRGRAHGRGSSTASGGRPACSGTRSRHRSAPRSRVSRSTCHTAQVRRASARPGGRSGYCSSLGRGLAVLAVPALRNP